MPVSLKWMWREESNGATLEKSWTDLVQNHSVRALFCVSDLIIFNVLKKNTKTMMLRSPSLLLFKNYSIKNIFKMFKLDFYYKEKKKNKDLLLLRLNLFKKKHFTHFKHL